MGRLDDQVALISGGASGLGLAIVERFVAEGACVAVLDRSEERCRVLEEQCEGVVTTVGDVRSHEDNNRSVTAALEHFGKLDCVIGNAGIWDFNIALADMEQDKIADAFNEILETNVLGYISLAKSALRPLVESRGSMIFTVSNAGFLPAGGGVMYTASKHAVVGVIRQLAFEFAPHVRVNGVAPGPIATQLGGPGSLGMQALQIPGEQFKAAAPGFVPLGVMPSPGDYAGAYVFFASRTDNIPATGTILNHDGGFGVRGLGPVPRGGDGLPEKLGL